MNFKKLNKLLEEFLTEDHNNEYNMEALTQDLDMLYNGIGWAEWDYYKRNLAIRGNFNFDGISDEELEKMINSTGIAKVKKVSEIKNYSDLEDFDPEDLDRSDKIILTRKPMSREFYGESNRDI